MLLPPQGILSTLTSPSWGETILKVSPASQNLPRAVARAPGRSPSSSPSWVCTSGQRSVSPGASDGFCRIPEHRRVSSAPLSTQRGAQSASLQEGPPNHEEEDSSGEGTRRGVTDPAGGRGGLGVAPKAGWLKRSSWRLAGREGRVLWGD